MTEYERGFIDGIKSKVSAELTPTLINVSKTMLEMLKPVLSTALDNALNDNNAITDTDVQPVNQWISVDEKLPDTVDDCLVWYSCDTAFGKSKSVGISFCSRYDWYKKHLNGDNIVVLYWMPLPEPPKDGEQNG